MARRAFNAAHLTAGPSFLEPVYLCEILAHEDAIGNIHSIINQRRGIVLGQEPSYGSKMKTIQAYLPVAESFGFGNTLLEATCGRVLFNYVFDHWDLVPGDIYDPSSRPARLAVAIRKAKDLNPAIPKPEEFLD